MSRPVPSSRPWPADWETNTLAARGWGPETATGPHRAILAWSLTGVVVVALAGLYGAIGWVLRNGPDGP